MMTMMMMTMTHHQGSSQPTGMNFYFFLPPLGFQIRRQKNHGGYLPFWSSLGEPDGMKTICPSAWVHTCIKAALDAAGC